jgi:AcrR family transcriptional regulator
MVKKDEVSRLGKQDWIDLGLKVLGESGVESVRVEPLAKLLQVTKGSFYWHFKNREEFLNEILQEWVTLNTSRIIEQVDQMPGNAIARLLILFELAVDDDGRVENAIRAWAARDPNVTAVLAQVDGQRLEYTKNLFLEIGFKPFDALVRARMVYYALVGEFTIGNPYNPAQRLAEIRLQHQILTRYDPLSQRSD